jgi:hypothetical protein
VFGKPINPVQEARPKIGNRDGIASQPFATPIDADLNLLSLELFESAPRGSQGQTPRSATADTVECASESLEAVNGSTRTGWSPLFSKGKRRVRRHP